MSIKKAVSAKRRGSVKEVAGVKMALNKSELLTAIINRVKKVRKDEAYELRKKVLEANEKHEAAIQDYEDSLFNQKSMDLMVKRMNEGLSEIAVEYGYPVDHFEIIAQPYRHSSTHAKKKEFIMRMKNAVCTLGRLEDKKRKAKLDKAAAELNKAQDAHNEAYERYRKWEATEFGNSKALVKEHAIEYLAKADTELVDALDKAAKVIVDLEDLE